MIDFQQPPTNGVITQIRHQDHDTFDFSCVTGSPVYDVHSGELTSDYNGRMGNIAIIKRNGRVSTYSHLQVVYPPGWYERGEVIDYVVTQDHGVQDHMFTLNQTNLIHSMDYEDTLHQLRR